MAPELTSTRFSFRHGCQHATEQLRAESTPSHGGRAGRKVASTQQHIGAAATWNTHAHKSDTSRAAYMLPTRTNGATREAGRNGRAEDDHKREGSSAAARASELQLVPSEIQLRELRCLHHVVETNVLLVMWAAECQLETAYGSCLVRPKVTEARRTNSRLVCLARAGSQRNRAPVGDGRSKSRGAV